MAIETMEFVAQLVLGLLFLGGLAVRERVVDMLASLETDADLVAPDDLE